MSKPGIWLAIANILIPIAVLTFAIGFFPYKPFLPGLAQYDVEEYPRQPTAPFNKVIFMVVDALRSDFVFSEASGFGFVQRMISDGTALPFTAHATSPTITMPRIKAMTTGSTPSFLDLILNFAESDTSSSLASQDTWLAQMKAKADGKMIMFGDDTWLKLFPDTFDRADGTSSFFVADFTEVDNNVTRHVPQELLNSDWNTMVLHYLGLDHIGHKAGPKSPNMVPKQKEMDGIIQDIYRAMEEKDYLTNALLVLAGDHGMNDAGNHGGSAPGETSPALVFISPKLKNIVQNSENPLPTIEDFQYYKTVEQSDIVPTLAGLLGFPVPRNNLGAFIPDFLAFWNNQHDRIQLLLQNAQQILPIVMASTSDAMFQEKAPQDCSHPASDMEQLRCDWLAIRTMLQAPSGESVDADESLIAALSKWSQDARELMSSAASNYDMTKLVGGIVVSTAALTFSIAAAWPSLSTSLFSTTQCTIITATYGILMFASSFVEEEHHFWYWITGGWFVFLLARQITLYGKGNSILPMSTGLSLLSCLRIIRRWNQTGQKFAGAPDIARTWMSTHTGILWALVVSTYLYNGLQLILYGFPGVPRANIVPSMLVLVAAAISFKLSFTKEDAPELLKGLPLFVNKLLSYSAKYTLVRQAQIVFSCILVFAIFAIFTIAMNPAPTRRYRTGVLSTITNLITTFLLTQSRTSNVPIYLLFTIVGNLLENLNLSPIQVTITTILLQHVSFFSMGGANAISSIDLSLAYNGVSGFNVIAVGLLTFIGNWAGPIWWACQGTSMLVNVYHRRAKTKPSTQERDGEVKIWQQHIALLSVFVTAHLVFVMIACTILRTHLFIWTVFSPKFLYSMAWSLGVHFLVNMLLGSGLFVLGGGLDDGKEV